MGIEIVELHEELLPGLARLVNEHIRSVPPGWTMTDSQVGRTIRDAPVLWGAHYPEEGGGKRRGRWRTRCALSAGRLAAAAQWHRPARDDSAVADRFRDTCFVEWLVADPASAESTAALLGDIERRARALGCDRIDVSPRFSFGVGWLGIPAVWPHLVEGLTRAGMKVTDRWVVMVADAAPAPPARPPQPERSALRFEPDEAAREWKLVVRQGRTLVGECDAWGIPEQFDGCRGFGEWITVEWIGVEDAFLRRGYGRLLMLEQMRLQAERGIRKVILWTETDNAAARRLCESLGFEYGPECWCLAKSLPGP